VADQDRIQGYLTGFAETSPNAGQTLAALVACAAGQIRTVACYSTGGTGSTPTIIDVRKNGVTVYTDPTHRPTLAGGQSGKFTSFIPNKRSFVNGDVLSLYCVQAGGHAGVIATAALEEP
jgi:hypothetical protein